MEMLYIGGSAMPAPSRMTVSLEDVGEASRRNARGALVADRIAVKRRVELEWPPLSQGDMASLMQAVTGGFFFTASYNDPLTGSVRSGIFRASERSAGVLRVENGSAVWTDVTMKWEEK